MNNRLKTLAFTSCAIVALATAAHAQDKAKFDIAGGDLKTALQQFATQTSQEVLFSTDVVAGRRTQGITAETDPQTALVALLDGTGLTYQRTPTGTLLVVRATDPQSGSAAGDGADSGTVQALIVTAQKREENIQDVPIAMSAFTQEALERSQVAGGPDLMTQVPNMTFTKTNFTSYSIQIRGIGTQAISATVDNAVAVAFNNTPFIRNRFFEQEFYDLQRVEVLRGPQGTLYGRNATAGVVNLISQKAKLNTYEAKLSSDVANYSSTRVEGMVNIPLANDVAALRIAGAWTKRKGYATNELTGNPIDGRDLWSTRMSLRFAPTDRLDANLIWEHFEENDDRIRSGKQLCKTDNVTEFTAVMPDGTRVVIPVTENTAMPDFGQGDGTGGFNWAGPQGTFSQGCMPASLYSPDSFQTPNGASAPYYGPVSGVGLPKALNDPYANRTQSHDLRVIESAIDPEYRAKADVFELQTSFDLTDALTLTSETGYSSDFTFSQQDYNRFNSAPHAWDASNPYAIAGKVLDANGVFCDPQIGCSDRLVAMDLATARSRHFSQELRIGSSFEGPFNFSLGANFLRYDTEDKYYVFINSLSLYAAIKSATASNPYVPGATDNYFCLPLGAQAPDTNGSGLLTSCTYIDPNPINSLNDQGHNYFLSRNPYKLISYAVFGESYYQITDTLKLTAGLRWTVDKKEAPRIPSWILAGDTIGLPVAELVEQEWRKPTGRLTIDWKPDLSFTDETLLYASYGHGYKAGGMNPPSAALVCYGGCGDYVGEWQARETIKPKKFEPEYVDAFELGSKNTMLDGRLTLTLAAFYYDYKGYQLSQIVDRSAITQNYDATVWGLEVEADWRPLENLRLGFKGGYEKTKVGDGMRAIDVMDRTAGHGPGSDDPWVVVSPFPTFPSNCVLPAWLFVRTDTAQPGLIGLGGQSGGSAGACELAYLFRVDPVTGLQYEQDPQNTLYPGGPPGVGSLDARPDYPGWDPTADYGNNQGEGFFKDLSGNELPNAPNFTATVTADYTVPLPNDWLATFHTDLYYQSEAWTRIFNTEGYDKLKAYTNVNLAAIFTNEERGWKVMAYVKNLFDRDSITGAFLNSDDSGLTTNVFLTEPRLFGLRVTKEWNSGPWWTGANLDHKGPFPLTVEVNGQVQRDDAPYGEVAPASFIPVGDAYATLLGIQNGKLDRGDGRGVKLTWRPDDRPWAISASYRYGRANSAVVYGRSTTQETLARCIGKQGDPVTGFFYDFVCAPGAPFYDAYPQWRTFTTTDFSDSSARTREKHQIGDLKVTYDWSPTSFFSRSALGLGMRYATFESETDLEVRAQGDWNVLDGWGYLPTTLTRNEADLTAHRQFSGAGPVLSWEAAAPIWGGDERGHLDVEWSVTGGVLYGDVKNVVSGYERVGPYTFAPLTQSYAPSGPATYAALPSDRSASATVPLADLSLGLAYEVGRVKLGAGYRWERYFDVLDVGYDEEQSADRTIDGPYFKIAIGFGD
jgi:outer membrane receptor protein involved in Fe transport